MPDFIVCPECEGHGYFGTLGEMTPEEFTEWYGDDADAYRAQHYASRVPCMCCKGSRVVTPKRAAEWEREDEERYQMSLEY